MADSCKGNYRIGDLEDLVRAAGRYVDASDDLRPRVLEAARLQCCERNVQSCVRRVAMFIALVGVLAAEFPRPGDGRRTAAESPFVSAGYEGLILPASAPTTRSSDFDWQVIDAFTKLRRQQAQLLRFEI